MTTANDVHARLAEDLNWFILCRELRVLHVETSATERSVVLQQIALAEFHGDNKSPFFVLEDAHTHLDGGWDARAERMRVIHERRREGMGKEGYALAPLPPLQHLGNPFATMTWQVMQCLEAQKGVAELSGVVVVLAPTVLEDPPEFAQAVRVLSARPELVSVRWIIVELGHAAAQPLLHDLGGLAMSAACVVDPVQHRQQWASTLAAMATAPPGASREGRAGFAGPRDRAAPSRARDLAPRPALPTEMAERIARELGPAAALLGDSGASLQRRISGAAAAVNEHRIGDAIRLQSEACEQCWKEGLTNMGCLLEAMLASYCLAAGDTAGAHRAFDVAARRAEAEGIYDVSAQALLGLAAVLVLERDPQRGAECYARAGEMAERAHVPLLAIEAYRTSGQVALQAGSEPGAMAVWQRALAVASCAGPETAVASSAPVVARALAKVLQGHGSYAAADSLLAQADEYEGRSTATAPAKVTSPQEAAREGAVHAG